MIVLDDVDSTMDELHRQAEAGAESGTAVLAVSQSAARGRLGRDWSSDQGGLWLAVLRRDVMPEQLESLSPRIGLAVAIALEAGVPGLPRLRLKWPNDLFLGGRKLGGILVEARWRSGKCDWVVVGVGVNLHNRLSPELAGRAIAANEVTTVPSAAVVAPAIIGALKGAFELPATLSPAELLEWSERDDLFGHRLSSPLTGVAQGITPSGGLRIRTGAGRIVELRTGEVAADGGPERD